MMNENTQNTDETVTASSDSQRARFVWLSEIGMVGGCVLVFFVFLIFLIKVYFPTGQSLVIDLDGSEPEVLSRRGDVDLGIDTETGDVERLFAGEILRIQRRVKHRGANSLTWGGANVGDKVVRNDAVQTFARSTAVLKLGDESQLTMGENSLIVFDKTEADPFLADAGSVLVMVDGELSGELSGAADTRYRFDVNLPNSDVTFEPGNPGDDVGFVITVNDDRSTTVNVHQGTAKIVGTDGMLSTIGDGQSVTIDYTGSDLRVGELAEAPRLASPSNNTSVAYRNVPQEITFEWHAVEDADRYRIVIARDQQFSDRIVDDDVIGTSFKHGALGPGSYYWRVRSRAGWSQGQQSSVRRLHVAQDLDPPTLELDTPPETIQAGIWRLQGRTDADAAVFIDDNPVEHDGGRIDYPIELRPGANVIVVKAFDDVGNSSYAPLLVNAK
jgi:hypothetical protein